MLFSGIPFLYFFFPVTLLIYFATPRKFKNLALLFTSLIFYFYGEQASVVLLLASIVVGYIAGKLIDKYRGTGKANLALGLAIILNLLLLGFFKYADFFIVNINTLLGTSIPLLRLSLPLGISFFVFQTISYVVDVYRGLSADSNPVGFAMYVSMFPQLVAGPIVRYNTVVTAIHNRVHSFDDFAKGVARFVIGLAKKVLIANALGELSATMLATGELSVLAHWLSIFSYMLQIYFDFSGYSDMAIGLGRMFGFHFDENFNYPFIANSISDFWRRWHISMGMWFREYLYIPLGGNRVSKLKWVRNIFIVWFCTGFWHGANWNFILWGLYFGVLLTIEKLFMGKLLEKLPALVRHVYVLLLVFFSFVIFYVEDLPAMWIHFQGMFGALRIPAANAEVLYYLRSYGLLLLFACIGATPLLKNLVHKLRTQVAISKVISAMEPVFYLVLMVVTTGYLVDSSFNPFLYFRF